MKKYITYTIIALAFFFLGGLVFAKIKVDQQLAVLEEVCQQGAGFDINNTIYFCFPAESPDSNPVLDTQYDDSV